MNWKVLASEASVSTRSKPSLAGRVVHKLIAMFCVAAIALTMVVVPMAGSASAAAKKTSITYWFWGEDDIPGITKWMQERITTYQKLNPGVTITLVPESTTTIIPSFALAVQDKSGPDIDTQWATLPVLLPAVEGAVAPISKYVKKSETSHWLNTSENTYKGALYAMPLYVIGVPFVWNKKLFKKAGLNPNKAPTTWSEFLADCAALKAHGITPFAWGNTDGSLGRWMFAIYEKQELNSISQLTEGVANEGNAQAKLLSSLGKMYTILQNLIKKGYINSNVSSLSPAQGWQLMSEGKAAMSFTTDGNALAWAKALGEKNLGVAAPPIWGTGKLAKTYDATQSSSELITSWSPNKAADAKFLEWLHTSANMIALNKETGAFPADNQFPKSLITDPMAKKLDALDTTGPQIWLENFIPPTIDNDANGPAGQLITSGGTAAQAVALWKQQLQLWQSQQPTQFSQFKKLTAGF